MTKENAKDFLPLVQALAEGKEIQTRVGSVEDNQWVNNPAPVFNLPIARYRIKPSSKYRPWKAKEVPVGALLKHIDTATNWTGLIVARDIDNQCLIPNGTSLKWESNAFVMSCYVHSTNQGKTWQPCGILVEE